MKHKLFDTTNTNDLPKSLVKKMQVRKINKSLSVEILQLFIKHKTLTLQALYKKLSRKYNTAEDRETIRQYAHRHVKYGRLKQKARGVYSISKKGIKGYVEKKRLCSYKINKKYKNAKIELHAFVLLLFKRGESLNPDHICAALYREFGIEAESRTKVKQIIYYMLRKGIVVRTKGD